ncbi:hypothetical protein L1049_005440 [Liquidambar formosana]|uniref:Uncharacterized protein n=1 Tax=Liquidambar formosana TaxID=63359 RepID=A0AAP0X1S2_LIQFO
MVFSSGGFQQLQVLTLHRLEELETWKVEEGVMRSSWRLDSIEDDSRWIAAYHKTEIMVQFRLPAMVLLVPYVLMLTTAFEALAETGKADNPVSNVPLMLELCRIITALRRQAKIESYAPSLSYASVGSRIPEKEAIVDQ